MTSAAARYGWLLVAFPSNCVLGQNTNGSDSNNNSKEIIGIVGAVVAVVAFIIFAFFFGECLRAGCGSSESLTPPDQYDTFIQQTVQVANQTVLLPERNLVVVCHGFDKGGFGTVYYGKLLNGAEVAVKINLEGSVQGTPEFVTEVSLLSRIHHRHLVSLMGYCTENKQQILIYEYMPEGTLQDHLYGKVGARKLTWRDRLHIALDSAKGLEYLHNGCKPSIIHRDIKSTNILLDAKLEAKVADFGISKVYPEDQTNSITTLIRGTFGYLDPEYFSSGHLTHKSDVYSFGVVLLELICGRRPYMADHEDPYQCSLVDWVRERYKEKDIESVVDPDIKSTYSKLALEKVSTLAIECVQMMPVNRPEMHRIVRKLSKAVQLEEQERNESGMPLEVIVHSEECEITPCSEALPLGSTLTIANFGA